MKILNFGSLNVDYVYNVDHFVRSGETISSNTLEIFPGGKGLNQSIALAKAGANVYHAGIIGKEGAMLRDTLIAQGVKVTYLKEGNGRSGHAIIQVDQEGSNNIILYGGANKEVDRTFVDEVLSHFSSEDIILLQNEISEVGYIIEKAHEKGMKIAFNPSPIDQVIAQLPLEKVKWFILNEIEGLCLIDSEGELGIPDELGITDKLKIADKLLHKYPEAHIVLTLGSEGIIYKDKLKDYVQPIYAVKVIDTTAAGDTFTGYYLAAIVQGLSVPQSLDRASKAAAIAVSRKGAATSIPTAREVKESTIKPHL